MDDAGIRAWFDRYVSTFAACGRGESDDLDALLEFYGVPLIVTIDDVSATLSAPADVTGFARQQVDAMRALDYDHTATLDSELTALNETSVLFRADLERRRADGAGIGRLRVTYLITDGLGSGSRPSLSTRRSGGSSRRRAHRNQRAAAPLRRQDQQDTEHSEGDEHDQGLGELRAVEVRDVAQCRDGGAGGQELAAVLPGVRQQLRRGGRA